MTRRFGSLFSATPQDLGTGPRRTVDPKTAMNEDSIGRRNPVKATKLFLQLALYLLLPAFGYIAQQPVLVLPQAGSRACHAIAERGMGTISPSISASGRHTSPASSI